MIAQEDHLVDISSEKIQSDLKNDIAVCLTDWEKWDPIWYIWSTEYASNLLIYNFIERWSLWIDKEYRWNGLSNELFKSLHEKIWDKLLIALTEVPQVHSLCQKNWYVWVPSDEVESTRLWTILKKTWPIEWYTVYMNPNAYKFYNIITNYENAHSETHINKQDWMKKNAYSWGDSLKRTSFDQFYWDYPWYQR